MSEDAKSPALEAAEDIINKLEYNVKLRRYATEGLRTVLTTIINEAIAESNADLIDQHARMAALIDELFEGGVLEGGSFDGDEIQDMIVKYDVGVRRKATREDLESGRIDWGQFEEGDYVYFRTDWLTTAAQSFEDNRKGEG